MSNLGEETKDLSNKVPRLESVVSYLSSKVHEEREKHNSTIASMEKTFAGLMSKIGALEGVINELHMHHELHEADHEDKEKEHLQLHEQGEQQLSQVVKHHLRAHEESEHAGNGGLSGMGRAAEEEEEEKEGVGSRDDVSTVLLVVASAHRPDYLKKCLTHIAEFHPK